MITMMLKWQAVCICHHTVK